VRGKGLAGKRTFGNRGRRLQGKRSGMEGGRRSSPFPLLWLALVVMFLVICYLVWLLVSRITA
jgi:hypothetical protein